MSSKIGIYVGSFNPITLGHVDIIRQALNIFDKVVVCVSTNSNKKYEMTPFIRHSLVKETITECFEKELVERIEVSLCSDLNIIQICEKNKSYNVIRGLRASSDYEYEAALNLAYREMCSDIRVILFLSNNTNMYVSSSIVRDVYKVGGQCKNLVSESVHKYLINLFSNESTI